MLRISYKIMTDVIYEDDRVHNAYTFNQAELFLPTQE